MKTIKLRSVNAISLAVLLALLVGTMACAPEQPRETSYSLLGGGEIKFSEETGKLILINYWAEWCTPCRKEIPELNAFQEEFPEQVLVLGVNFDGVVGEELEAQVKKMGISFAQLIQDPRQTFAVSPSGVLPETLVIDRRGEFQKVLLGPQTLDTFNQLVATFKEEIEPYQ